MGTIIDELVIKLNLDAKGFTSGQKQATSAFQKTKEESISIGKSMEESGKQAAEFFGKIRNAALGMFAAFTAGRGIEQFTRQTISTNAELGRTAENLSMSGRALSAWQKAVELAGGSAGEVTETLEGLRKTYQDMLMGQQPQNSAALSMLGLTKEDLADPEKRLDILIQKVRTFAANPRHTRAQSFEVAREAGLSKGLINLALSPDSEKLLAEGSANAVTESQIKAAQRVQTALVDLQQKWEKLGNFLVERFAGDIEKVVAALGSLADWLQAHPDDLAKVFGGALIAVGLLSKAIIGNLIALALSPLTFALGGVTKGAAEATAGIATLGATTSLSGLLGMLTRISAALAALWILFDPTEANAQEEKDRKSIGEGGQLPGGQEDGMYPVQPSMWDRARSWMRDRRSAPATDYMDAGGHMVPNADLVGMVKKFEGFSEKAYWDNKQWSIGYGTRAVGPNDTITREEAEKRLMEELAKSAARVDKAAGAAGMTLNKNQRNSLTDFDYNTGSASKIIGQAGGDASKLPGLMKDYINAGGQVNEGLIARRRWDSQLFQTPGPQSDASQYLRGLPRPGMGMGQLASASGGSSQTHIGQIVVHTAATDAKGIARDIGTEMRKYGFVAQANMGLS